MLRGCCVLPKIHSDLMLAGLILLQGSAFDTLVEIQYKCLKYSDFQYLQKSENSLQLPSLPLFMFVYTIC